jgi:phenylalanine-4-hydroxylase
MLNEAPEVTTDLVQLDRDHPGFRDRLYRARRNEIAKLALSHRFGDPAPEIAYAPGEQGVWKTALEHLAPLHARYACDAFKRAWPLLGLHSDRIAQFTEVNAFLARHTGFALSPVAGLVTPRVFMSHLASRRFLATQYIRHESAPLYTPEPDVVHELVGHAALLADPEFARINRMFGEATLVGAEETIQELIRVYWYTLEFGVVRGRDGFQVVGAGLLSSFGELGRFEREARIEAFDIESIAATPFDPTDYQGNLFAAESVGEMFGALEEWLGRILRAGGR